MIFMLQIVVEDVPEGKFIFGGTLSDDELVSLCLSDSSSSLFRESELVLQRNGGGYFSGAEASLACVDKGIEIFLGWNLVINPRDCLIGEFRKAFLLQIVSDGFEGFAGKRCCHLVAGEQTAIRESLMGNQFFFEKSQCQNQKPSYCRNQKPPRWLAAGH